MTSPQEPRVAIVDYGLGNLHSVAQACAKTGMRPRITSRREELADAHGVILPGVGAFGDAMNNLAMLDLVEPIISLAKGGKPLVGICLGLQLLMEKSEEFGSHQGLGLIKGRVVRLAKPMGPKGPLKVPQVGWNRVFPAAGPDQWQNTPLEDLTPGEYQYFVHSYYVRPSRPEVALCRTTYGDVDFCSAVSKDNVLAFQYHPERSGEPGLNIYRALADLFRRGQ